MDENPQKAVRDILLNSFTPQPEQETEQEPQETASSETLETQTTEPEKEEVNQEAETQTDEDISTLNKLAETLDIPIEDMYALNFNMPNGDPVSLGGLKDFYEQNTDLEASRQEIENERSKLQTEKDKLREVPPASQEHIEALAQVRMIEGEWQQLETSGLKQTDAGQYSARAIELQNKYSQATGILNNIQQIIEGKRSERVAEHQRELHKLVPELKEEATRQVAVQRVTKMFDHYGLSHELLGAIDDHHAMHLLLDMSKLFEQKGNYKSKRVDTAPKVLKPQAVRNSEAGRAASLKRLTEKARKSGERADQTAAVSALLIG